jgi:hypothetical protein
MLLSRYWENPDLQKEMKGLKKKTIIAKNLPEDLRVQRKQKILERKHIVAVATRDRRKSKRLARGQRARHADLTYARLTSFAFGAGRNNRSAWHQNPSAVPIVEWFSPLPRTFVSLAVMMLKNIERRRSASLLSFSRKQIRN